MSRSLRQILRSTLFVLCCLGSFTVLSAAQNCGWDKVNWTGHYELTESGTVTQPEGTYTINNTLSADFAPPAHGGLCPGQLLWFEASDPNYTVSANDKFVGNPCGTETLTGSGGLSQSSLLIDPTAGTYSFFMNIANVNYTETDVACNGFTSTTSGTLDLADPGPLWPFTFALPGAVQALSQSVSFQAPDPRFGQLVTYTFTFTLTPTPHDDKVDDQCGQPRGSVIGCQNQTLGEDIPIVGTGFSLHYESDRVPGRADANAIAEADARSTGGWTLNVHHAYDPATNSLFLGDGTRRSSWQLAGSMTYNGNTLVTSEDGSEIYLFDLVSGRHVQTLKPLTGAMKYQFTYDAFGNLVTIKDGSNNVTTIQRDGAGRPTAIVSPFGQATTLTLDGNGFLSQATDPAGHIVKFTSTSGGLMTSRTDANGNVYTYIYDGNGRLTKDSDPAGGFVSLNRSDTGAGYNVTKTTASGRTTTYGVATGTPGEHFINTWPSGLQATVSNTPVGGQLSESTVLPDGTTATATQAPDPRWGLQAPIMSDSTLTLGSLTADSIYARTVALAVPGNPFSLTSQTDTATVNGRTYASAFTTSTRTYLDTTPVGRTTTRVLDSLERLSKLQVSGMAAMKFTYDTKGRLSKVNFGPRITKFNYGSDGLLSSTTDPLNLTTSFIRDSAGRVVSTALPDGRVITYSYDANGNLVALTPPGKSPHDFAWTSVNLMSSYLPPAANGGGPTTFGYNLDRDLTNVTHPDGQTINFSYDSAGRLISTTTPTGVIRYGYDPLSGNLNSASIAGGEAITYNYDGPLSISTTWAGAVAGSVGRTYNNNFWIASQNINGANNVNFTYDDDGLLKKAGALVVSRNPKNGLAKGATLGKTKDTLTSNTFGEPTAYAAKYGTTVLYSTQFVRDAGGRITQKTETIGGVQNIYGYSYDQAGRLVGVTINGVNSSSYSYDSNSNRLSAVTPSGTANGNYDGQDRALTYGNAAFTYSANGELVSRTAASQTTTYSYDVLGNLTAVHLPTTVNISYVVDSWNRRVGKLVNGVLQNGFLYDSDQLVAQLDGSNQIVSQFVYGTGGTSPDVMIRGGVTYRIFSDHLGSPRLVVNSSTGAIVQRMDYDEFGNVLNDTNPGFQPFGFAGGLYDPDTKLVRFGARDYDPTLGRWTARDPILFAGGDTNLYGYVMNDPLNWIDPSGLEGGCNACKAKETGEEIVRRVLKTALKQAAKATNPEAIQKAMAKETAHPALREYKFGLEQAKERANDSVAPASKSLQNAGKTCVRSLSGGEELPKE